jgi:protein-tyrosine phosphatase
MLFSWSACKNFPMGRHEETGRRRTYAIYALVGRGNQIGLAFCGKLVKKEVSSTKPTHGWDKRMKQVLFLCSANFYRSRFAEHLFNWLAEQEDLSWRADSRGLAVDQWGNIGQISHYTTEALQQRSISASGSNRRPRHVTVADLANADLVIAVKEAEHRAMMVEQFPLWADQIEYWHIDDIDCAEPEDSLPILEEHIRALITRLRAMEASAAA